MEPKLWSRRWISASRWRENRGPSWMTDTGGKVYDVQRDAWHEFVVVPDDDPKAETFEVYGD